MRLPQFIIALSYLMMLTFPAWAGTAIDAAKCSNCHNPTKIADFAIPAVKAVDRSTACLSCHNERAHRYVVVLPEGRFQNVDSINTPYNLLHYYHAGDGNRKWMAADSYCGKCHSDVKCTTCHKITPHQEHSTTVYTTDQTFMTADGVYRSFNNLSCSISQCHGRLLDISSAINPNLTLVPAAQGAAIDAAKCANCHNTKVSDFAVPAIKTVDRSTACQKCHSKTEHKYKVVLPQGKFLTSTSVNTPFSSLHTIHAGEVNGKSMAKNHFCGQCHADASCTSCHATIPHKEHAKTVYSSDQNFRVSDGVSKKQNNLNCTLSQCHGRLTGIK